MIQGNGVCERPRECSAGGVRRPELCSQQFCPRPSRCCCGRHFNKMGLERTSLFTVQYFLGGSPKEKNVFLVHLLLVMHTATWWHSQNNYPDLFCPRGAQYMRSISLHICKFYFPGWNPLERDHSQSISSLQRNFLLFELTPCDQDLQVLSV